MRGNGLLGFLFLLLRDFNSLATPAGNGRLFSQQVGRCSRRIGPSSRWPRLLLPSPCDLALLLLPLGGVAKTVPTLFQLDSAELEACDSEAALACRSRVCDSQLTQLTQVRP